MLMESRDKGFFLFVFFSGRIENFFLGAEIS